jgi:hypothetical protein
MHYALWSVLACGVGLMVAAVPCGFARDLEIRATTQKAKGMAKERLARHTYHPTVGPVG